jgi:hypothetical protein
LDKKQQQEQEGAKAAARQADQAQKQGWSSSINSRHSKNGRCMRKSKNSWNKNSSSSAKAKRNLKHRASSSATTLRCMATLYVSGVDAVVELFTIGGGTSGVKLKYRSPSINLPTGDLSVDPPKSVKDPRLNA